MPAGPYYYMYTVAGPDRLSVTDRARHWELLEVLMRTRVNLDPEPLIPFLTNNVVYDSQSVMTALDGKDAVSKYLRGKHLTLRTMAGQRDLGRFIPATIGLPKGEDYPCLIFEADGKWEATFYLDLDAEGMIARIQILTVAPPPHEAKPLPAGGDPKLAPSERRQSEPGPKTNGQSPDS